MKTTISIIITAVALWLFYSPSPAAEQNVPQAAFVQCLASSSASTEHVCVCLLLAVLVLLDEALALKSLALAFYEALLMAVDEWRARLALPVTSN
jgi:hypothetical protein